MTTNRLQIKMILKNSEIIMLQIHLGLAISTEVLRGLELSFGLGIDYYDARDIPDKD